MIQMPVGVELVDVPLNLIPMVDQTDGYTREEGLVFTDFNTAVGELIWNFVTSAGVQTATVVTAVTGTSGNYHITHKDGGMYTTLIPASGGASINNNQLGYGWFSGKAQGALPFRGPIIAFGLNITVHTTISSLTSQLVFRLAAGSSDDDAYNGYLAIIRDAAGTAQTCLGVVADYDGGLREVTLDADPGVFTMVGGDYVSLVPAPLGLSTEQKANVNAEADTAVAGLATSSAVAASDLKIDAIKAKTDVLTFTGSSVQADMQAVDGAAVSQGGSDPASPIGV